MSKYTVQLRRIAETFSRNEIKSWFEAYELSDYLTAEEIAIINKRGTFDKNKLSDMIVDYYWMSEIGFETVGLFRHYTKLRMKEIMEKYSFLLYSMAIKIDPLVNEDYTETISRNVDQNGSSETQSDASDFSVASDTPQTNINKKDLLNGSYATTTQASQSEGTNSSSGKSNTTEEINRHTKGNRGIESNAPYLIGAYRKYIITIYGDIVKECRSLFMGIY